MVMDTLALAVSASANYALRHREAQRMLLPLIAFPICGLADLFCIFHELKAVQLRSLNRERAEMTADFWLQQGAVRAAADMRACGHTCMHACMRCVCSCARCGATSAASCACMHGRAPQLAAHARALNVLRSPACRLPARLPAAPLSPQAPCFRDISARERLWGPPDIANNLLPLRILPLERSVAGPGQLVQLLSAYKGSKYLLSLQPGA